MIAAAAFAVAACSKTESTNVTVDNATDMNAANAMEGTVNDTMTNADGAMDNAANSMDNAANAMTNATNATNAM
ncbi:circumsporozoite protein [Sphingomonas sp. SUN039]|uniref:circumsporozoite protein n=1 Tax=Sphingomonas sp. SUN039 TaxID=2937787 RepID=UPI00216420E6|nr:circumsporozoite protein [Sphingomonas sp. SUN039]UVO53985.1 circumsporozoite protein [Sphingomonas sp. SUN039]